MSGCLDQRLDKVILFRVSLKAYKGEAVANFKISQVGRAGVADVCKLGGEHRKLQEVYEALTSEMRKIQGLRLGSFFNSAT